MIHNVLILRQLGSKNRIIQDVVGWGGRGKCGANSFPTYLQTIGYLALQKLQRTTANYKTGLKPYI